MLNDELRVVFATFTLHDEAGCLWETEAGLLKRSLGMRQIARKAFVDTLYEKYFLQSIAK